MSNLESEIEIDLAPVQLSAAKYPPQEGDLVEHVIVSSYSSRSPSSNKSRSKSSSNRSSSNKSRSNKSRSKSSSNKSLSNKSRSRRSSSNKSLSQESRRSQRSKSRSSASSTNELMDECQTFIDVLTEVLEQPDNIDASIYCANPENIEEECDDFYVFINIWNKITRKSCAYVKYVASEKTIHIEEIVRCSGEILPEQGTGTDIIKKLVAVGDKFRHHLAPGTKLTIMVDSDQSKLYVKKVEFDLNWLYIFATGESWYNSLGFEEDEYADNTEFLADFIAMEDDGIPIKEYFQKVKSDLKNPDITVKTLNYYKHDLEKTINKFNAYISTAVKNGEIASGQFRTKFSNIAHEYPVSGVGFGLKGKKKRKTRKNGKKGKKRQ